MYWALLRPTEECPVHEMWPVMFDTGEFQAGHVSGIDCACLPCLDDRIGDAQVADGESILFHHVLYEGKPLMSVANAHTCRLKDVRRLNP